MKNEIIQVGQVGIRFLLQAADTNGAVAMFEFTVPAGAKVPLPHSHQHYDETIYGVEGVVTFTVEGKPVDIGPGESCFVPRGAVHGFNNLKQTDARGLVPDAHSLAFRGASGNGSAGDGVFSATGRKRVRPISWQTLLRSCVGCSRTARSRSGHS